MQNTKMLDAALHYAEMGFAVFPLKPRDKTPMTHHGCKDASSDPQQIKRWWKRCPDSNIGLATGAISGNICVIDIDIDEEKGIDGTDTLSAWEGENGRLPTTAIAITGRGGYHYYFRIYEPIKNRTAIMDGIDFRGDGGYVVAPPSVHSNGNEYEWEYDIEEYPIAVADDVVLKLLKDVRKSSKQTAEEKFDIGALIKEGGRNHGIFKAAAHYQALSYGDTEIRVLVHALNKSNCNPPLPDDEVDKAINSALGYAKGKSDEYKVKHYDSKHQSINDMLEAIHDDEKLDRAVKYNSLAYTPWIAGKLPWDELTQREWTDVDDANYFAYMEKFGFKSHDKMLNALTILMEDNKFSPIKEHLECLRKTWDGKKRVDTMLQDYLGADDTPLNRAIMRLFMYGAIKRAYEPGCQFDYMLILVGEQGIGKSTFLRRLAMKDVWFDGNFNTIDGTIAVERLRGMWIVEMSELLAMKRSKEVEAMKSFVTNRSDNYRAPYARRTTARPRQCVFAGSTNDNHFLTDTTGNRRFLPVRTHAENVKLDLFAKDVDAYFEQAWAEALHDYFEQKPRLVLSKDLQKDMKALQDEFTEDDYRIGVISDYLERTKADRTCAIDLWENALNMSTKPTRKESNEIHEIMRNMEGWEGAKVRCGSYGVQKGYIRISNLVQVWAKTNEENEIPF